MMAMTTRSSISVKAKRRVRCSIYLSFRMVSYGRSRRIQRTVTVNAAQIKAARKHQMNQCQYHLCFELPNPIGSGNPKDESVNSASLNDSRGSERSYSNRSKFFWAKFLIDPASITN